MDARSRRITYKYRIVKEIKPQEALRAPCGEKKQSEGRMSLQDIILKLQEYWSNCGCYIASGYDNEVGAGTMTPDTFFRVLGKKHWKVAYWQPSRRPDDGRYAQNLY